MRSKCLVPIFSPLYFQSVWCRKECAAMLKREARTGFRRSRNSGGLIIPINVFGGSQFPRPVKDIEWLDCRRFWVPGEGFSKREDFADFVEAVREWALGVASVLQAAPAWQDTWLDDGWENLPEADLNPLPNVEHTSEIVSNPGDIAQVQTAIDAFLDTDQVEPARQLVRAFLKPGSYGLALLLLDYILLRLRPAHELYSRILANKGYALIGLSRYEKAIECLEEVRRQRLDERFHAWHAVALAYAYFRAGNSPEFYRWLNNARQKPEYAVRREEFIMLYPEIAADIRYAP